MDEHTPTPWRVIAGDDYYIAADAYPKEFIGKFKGDDTGDYVAWVGNRPEDFGEANAAFICKAVNNHEAMDKLLAEAADMLNTTPRMEAMDLGNKITQFRLGLQKQSSVGVGGTPK